MSTKEDSQIGPSNPVVTLRGAWTANPGGFTSQGPASVTVLHGYSVFVDGSFSAGPCPDCDGSGWASESNPGTGGGTGRDEQIAVECPRGCEPPDDDVPTPLALGIAAFNSWSDSANTDVLWGELPGHLQAHWIAAALAVVDRAKAGEGRALGLVDAMWRAVFGDEQRPMGVGDVVARVRALRPPEPRNPDAGVLEALARLSIPVTPATIAAFLEGQACRQDPVDQAHVENLRGMHNAQPPVILSRAVTVREPAWPDPMATEEPDAPPPGPLHPHDLRAAVQYNVPPGPRED